MATVALSSSGVVRVAKSLSLCQHLLLVIYNNPARVFSVEDLLRTLKPQRRNLKRKTVTTYLRRFLRWKLIEKVSLADHIHYGYRLYDAQLSNAYILGDDTKPWLKVTLNPPPPAFEVEYLHRIRYLLQLQPFELEIAKRYGQFKPNLRTGGSYVLTAREFILVANTRSGKGEIFLLNGWERAIYSMFGNRLASFLKNEVEEGHGRREISLPVEFVNKRIRVGGSDMVWGASHSPIEIDVQGPESDTKLVKALQMTTDATKFNAVILDIQETLSMIAKGMKALADNQSELSKKQDSALGELKRLVDLLAEGLVKGEGERKYDPKPPTGDDFSFV